MQQVEVDVVRVEPFELFVEVVVEVGGVLHEPERRFRGDEGSIPVAVLQGLADDALALSVVVNPGGIEVVHAVVHSVAQDADGLGNVDRGSSHGQTHCPETEL